MAIIPLVALISILLFGIEELAVQLEEPFSIFPMQGFYNNIYENSHKLIFWDTNYVKKNVERVTVVMLDASDVSTIGVIMS